MWSKHVCSILSYSESELVQTDFQVAPQLSDKDLGGYVPPTSLPLTPHFLLPVRFLGKGFPSLVIKEVVLTLPPLLPFMVEYFVCVLFIAYEVLTSVVSFGRGREGSIHS